MEISVIAHYYLHRNNDIPEFHSVGGKRQIDFKSITLVMVNFFDDDFNVVDKAALLVVEVAEVGSCTATMNVLISVLTHMGFVKLFQLFIITPWFSISLKI